MLIKEELAGIIALVKPKAERYWFHRILPEPHKDERVNRRWSIEKDNHGETDDWIIKTEYRFHGLGTLLLSIHAFMCKNEGAKFMVALQCNNSAYKLTQMGYKLPDTEISETHGKQDEWVLYVCLCVCVCVCFVFFCFLFFWVEILFLENV